MPGRIGISIDYSSLYPKMIMKDWAKDEKFIKELQRIKLIKERRKKLENLNKICVGMDQKEHQEFQE